MTLDPLILSRMQFAWVIGWHILLPAFTVGLASFIAFVEGVYFFEKNEIYLRISSFWTRIFSISFGMGVVSGIIMPFQFGTNWSRFSDATANIISPMLAYEGLTAFFLEATFLGILLFGRSLVPRWVHFFAALMVALGTLISTFWILATNSWMQTPQGYTIKDGRFFPQDWWAIIFNPSFPYRLMHTVIGFYITTGFVVIGVAAYLIRKQRSVPEARVMLSTTLWILLLLVPLQIFLGDQHGLNTLRYQPTKLAAMEGRWETRSRAPLTLFALPDQQAATNRLSIEVPVLGSLLLTHDANGVVYGLKDVPADQRPQVAVVFFAFRVMVGTGLLMLSIVLLGLVLRRHDAVFENRLYLRACQYAGGLGFIAIIAGWTVTETGRQPWVVYGLMRTANAVAPSLKGADVLLSLTGYIVAYAIMFPAGVMLMARVVRKGVGNNDEQSPVQSGRAHSPIAAVAGASSKPS